MKRILTIIVALTLGASVLQAREKNLTYLHDLKINDTTFVKKGRDITLKMDLDFSELRLGSQHTVALIPVYVSKDGSRSMPFPSVVIDGKTRNKIYLRSQELESVDAPPMHDGNAQVILRSSRRDPQTYEYAATIPYERWMLEGRVELREKIHGCVNCNKGESVMHMFGDPIPVFVPQYLLGTLEPEPEPVKVREESRTARISFRVNKYDILPDFKDNRSELDTVLNSILLVKNNPDVEITGIYVDGYASPEGTIEKNLILSKNRAESLTRYIRKNTKVEESLFNVAWHGEDWEGFKKMMLEENRYPSLPKRDEVVRILKESTEDSDATQKKIESLQPRKDIYLEILNKLYPELRRNEYRIVYDVRNFDLEEARQIINTRPDLLSLKEMYMVAGSYEKGSEGYEKAMATAAKHYPKSPAVLNDRIMDIMEEKDYKAVVDILEASRLTDNNAVLLNALGVAYTKVGDPLKAEEIFRLAVGEGSEEAKHNLEQVRKVIDQL